MAKDRARDDRRSVGSHEKMMSALGTAAGAVNIGRAVFPTMKTSTSPKPPVLDVPGRGHVKVGRGYKPEVQGTAGISGEYEGPRGAPSNIKS